MWVRRSALAVGIEVRCCCAQANGRGRFAPSQLLPAFQDLPVPNKHPTRGTTHVNLTLSRTSTQTLSNSVETIGFGNKKAPPQNQARFVLHCFYQVLTQ